MLGWNQKPRAAFFAHPNSCELDGKQKPRSGLIRFSTKLSKPKSFLENVEDSLRSSTYVP